MESALESILINTYNPDPSLRKQAELALEQFVRTAGSLAAIINCVGHVTMHRELRQATALVLKNRLRDYFAKGEDGAASPNALPSSDQERAYLKEKLVEVLLVELDNSIRGILAESVRIIAEFEFPENWPNLVPTLIAQTQQPDVLKVYNALLALRKLVKRYEYKAAEKRQPLNDTLQYSFPHLQSLMTAIIHLNTIEAAQVMRVCLKIFWSSTNYMLPKVSGVDVNLWFSLICEIMNKRLPEASEGLEPRDQPVSLDDRKMWPWWKLKKWAARIMTHFIQRYGNPRFCNDDDKAFAEYFKSNTAIQLLGPAMVNLQWKAQGAYLTEDVHRSCLTYVSNCAEMSPTYKLIKPHIQFVLFEVVFPTLCMTAEDAQLFDEDPVEFIRKVHDPVSDWLSPTVAATNLLQMLARYRQKDVMPIFLPFLQELLTQYNNSPPETRDYRKKDGAIVALASLTRIMKDNDDYERLLLPILIHHILPEFKSPIAFLRSRACWAIEFFAEIDWKSEATQTDITQYLQQLASGSQKKEKKSKSDKKTRRGVVSKSKKSASGDASQMTAGEALQSVLHSLLQALRDPALPVQTAAACSLRLLISEDGATDLLRPLLPEIVREYFRIMEEAENESILAALQAIVTQYGEEIADIAPMMTQHLVQSFHKYAAETSDDDEEAAFNAVQCLDTIDAIVDSVYERVDVTLALQPLLLPLFLSVLNSNGEAFEYLDTIINMLNGFTYNGETLSPALWEVCGPMLHTLNDWAIDYVGEMSVPLINFMTKGMATFLQGSHNGQPFVHILFEIVKKTFENAEEGYSGREINSAATLLTCLLTNCTQNVPAELASPLITPVLQLVLHTLPRVKLAAVKVHLLEVLLSALYLDTQTTLRVVRELCGGDAQAASVWALLFQSLSGMKRDLSQRLVVLGLSALLCAPAETLPEMVRVNFPSMFQQVIRELIHIEEEARREHDEDEDEEEDDDDDFDFDVDDDEDDNAPFDESDAKQAALRRAKALHVPDGGYGEDEDCVNAEDEEYRQALEQMDSEERVKKELGADAFDDEEDDAGDYVYTSHIQNFNMSQLFLTAMQGLQARDGALAASLNATLTAEDAARLQQVVHFAANPAVVDSA